MRTSSLEGTLLARRGQTRTTTSLLQIEVFIEAATTRGNIRRTASTKLALCGSCTRGRIHRRDQVSFFTRVRENIPSLSCTNVQCKKTMVYILCMIISSSTIFFCRDLQTFVGHAIASTFRTSRLINNSLFIGTVDIIIVENTTRYNLIHGV